MTFILFLVGWWFFTDGKANLPENNIASEEIKFAMKYHGIQTCKIYNDECTFDRAGTTHQLFTGAEQKAYKKYKAKKEIS